MSRARDLADYVSTGVTSDELNLLDGSDTGPLSHRNLIINGAMNVAQRGTSNINVSSTGVYTLDRFLAEKDTNTMTASQSTDAPTGFKYSLKLENGTGASANSSDINFIRYFAEGYDTNHLEIGTSNAKTVTLSFWVKSSIAGTYCVAFFDQGNDNPYVTTYTINSVNTWEQKVITLTLSTYGSWVGSTTNEANLGIVWDLGSGSDRQVSTLNTWHDGVANDWSHSSQTAWVETTGATFYLTGVQLELGSVATPFEHRSYGEELARCQRYYLRLNASSLYTAFGVGVSPGTSSNYINIPIPVSLRGTPSPVGSNLATSNGGAGTAVSSVTLNGFTESSINLTVTGGTYSVGQAVLLQANNNSSAYIEFKSEL